jgi:hypothetical protein
MNNRNNRYVSPEAKVTGRLIVWFVLFMIMATIFGIWIKLFWLGWVFQP